MAPEILAALAEANAGNVSSYGADAWTLELTARLRTVFEKPDLVAYPVATGTAANALAPSVLVPPYGAVLCAEGAHIDTGECGAPEFFTGGAKLVALPAPDGRLDASRLMSRIGNARASGIHESQPRAISITQSTDWGTVHGVDDVQKLGQLAASHGLALHMDGARFANALVHLGRTPAEMTWKAGVTALSFGATKNGAMAAEAVIFFDPARAAGFEARRKRAAHLWSKQRFMSAQLLAYLRDDLWLRHARHANAMAGILARGLAAIAGVRLLHPCQANEVFAALPEAMAAALEEEGFGFYRWPVELGPGEVAVRLVASFMAKPGAVEALVRAAQRFSERAG